jgi:hypothetical protein
MTTLLQIDFPSAGPFGAQMSQAYADLAASIATEPGLLWKIWTENATEQTAGGIYLFADETSAHAYATMHTKRLESFGVTGIRALYFDVNEPLTATTRGPVS